MCSNEDFRERKRCGSVGGLPEVLVWEVRKEER